jgi:hypothetical protein
MKIVIEFDPLDRSIKISENEFTTFEAFGVLEAAKQLISFDWMAKTAEESQ